jgi:hypothetical protein
MRMANHRRQARRRIVRLFEQSFERAGRSSDGKRFEEAGH